MNYEYYRCQSCGWHFRLFKAQHYPRPRVECVMCNSGVVIRTTWRKFIEFRTHYRSAIKPWIHEVEIERIKEVEQ